MADGAGVHGAAAAQLLARLVVQAARRGRRRRATLGEATATVGIQRRQADVTHQVLLLLSLQGVAQVTEQGHADQDTAAAQQPRA